MFSENTVKARYFMWPWISNNWKLNNQCYFIEQRAWEINLKRLKKKDRFIYIFFPKKYLQDAFSSFITNKIDHYRKLVQEFLSRYTPERTHSISGLKSQVSKVTFLLKNDGEKWPRLFYFEIQRAPSELLLPSAKKICSIRLNWQGRLAGISEGAR